VATLRFRHSLSFYETRWLWGHLCQQDTALCSRWRAAECVNIRAAWKIGNGRSGWVTEVLSCILFYSILWCDRPFFRWWIRQKLCYAGGYYFDMVLITVIGGWRKLNSEDLHSSCCWLDIMRIITSWSDGWRQRVYMNNMWNAKNKATLEIQTQMR
jgi:hypothetical protein